MNGAKCPSLLLSAFLAVFVGRALPAEANGRYPAAGLVAVDPSDPSHLVVRTTYGVLSTRDGGKEWAWICEAAIGYGGVEDPMIAITANGSILAGIFNGLSTSTDGGCGWGFAGGGLKDRYVTDLSVERADPSRAVLINSNGVDNGMFLTQLWESTNNGASWAQAGVDLPGEFLGLTVDTAPSDPMRVYASGRYGAPDYPGALERSMNRGASWEKLSIVGADDAHLPYIAAIDPIDPNVIYVRLDGEPTDTLLVSTDAGESWKTIFEGTGGLLGFALSPDGKTILVGGKEDGIWRAPTTTLAFEKVSKVGTKCLTWTADGVFTCADEFIDGFTVGLSKDEGASFTPIMHLGSPCAPLSCGSDTATGSKCPSLWPAVKQVIELGGGSCGGPADAGADAGTPTPSEGGGCGCRAAPAGEIPSYVAAGILVTISAAARRRKSRAAARWTRLISPTHTGKGW